MCMRTAAANDGASELTRDEVEQLIIYETETTASGIDLFPTDTVVSNDVSVVTGISKR